VAPCRHPKKYPEGMRDRAIRLVQDLLADPEAENRELRRANAILKTASAFFAAELDRPSPRS
jgi:transposase-like protein